MIFEKDKSMDALCYTLYKLVGLSDTDSLIFAICVQTPVPRSASFNVRHVPLTNLTNRVPNMDMIHEDRSSTSTESAPVTKLDYAPKYVGFMSAAC